jgi:hypothetical protein
MNKYRERKIPCTSLLISVVYFFIFKIILGILLRMAPKSTGLQAMRLGEGWCSY